MKQYIYIFITGFFLVGLYSCQAPGGNNPGSEYMPDMAHSIAFEANHYQYYYNHIWGGEDEYYKFAQPRKPVAGTIPRTSTNAFGDNNIISIPTVVGVTPYDYADTEEERTRAMNEIIKNPYPITDAGLADGKNLYNIYCSTCHGDKGDGGGYLVRDDGGVYPAAPANFLLEEHLLATNGRYYHAIMHGKNLMGSYKDKLNTEERWQVIHYIRSLQAKELKKEYSQLVNTLNNVDMPAGSEIVKVIEKTGHDMDSNHENNHDHGDEHNEIEDHDDHNDHGHDH